MASASRTSGSGPVPGGSRAQASTASQNTLLDDINHDCVVPVCDITCPQYCFKLEADFTLKNDKKNKPKYRRQYERVGVIQSGAMNTSGGILAVTSQTQVKQDVIDKWSNNLPSQLSFMPSWVYTECVSIHFSKLKRRHRFSLLNTKYPAVVYLIKRSPRTVTYNSHMFVRRPEGSSQVADTETALAVLARPRANRQQPSAHEFTMPRSYTYGEQLPPESETLEYKHWSSASAVADLIHKVKDYRTTKGLFSLANNQTKSYLLIGVNDADCTVIGLVLSDADKPIFRGELSKLMLKDDDGNLRIWGEEGRTPVQGTDWDLTFVPVDNCPNGQLRVVIIVTMHPCSGGLFERCPECYILEDDGTIEMLSFSAWKGKITKEAKISTISSPTPAPSAARAPSVNTTPTAVITASVSIAPSVATTTSPADAIGPFDATAPSDAVAPPTATAPSAAATDTYKSASWTSSSDWRRYIVADDNDSGSSSDADQRYDLSTMMKMEKGINLSPSLDNFCLKYPASSAHIKSMFGKMKLKCRQVPACAVTFKSWADNFNHKASIQPPAGHILDSLIICQNNRLQMWVCVEAQGDVVQQKSHATYAYGLCRVLQKHMLIQQRNIEPYQAINIQITPVLFYADVNQSNTALLDAGDPIAELNCVSMSSVSGVRLEGLQSAAISLLIRNVWIRDRVGRDKTYHLTKQQVNGLCQLCSQRISLIEAAPGCGKSVMAISVCSMFRPDEVLYLSPSKGFTSLVDYQGVATAKHVQNDKDVNEVIVQIRDTDYHIVVIDDIQAMDCSTYLRTVTRPMDCSPDQRRGLWTNLLEAVYSRDHTKVMFLMDSQYQDYHKYETCSDLKESIRRFCEKKRVPFCSIPLSQNMRNCRKVFSFLKAQILKEPGVGLVNEDLRSGHSVDGDDVVVRYLDDPWLDTPDNELIKLVQGLIGPQNERGYEAKDIVILVDIETVSARSGNDDKPYSGDELDSSEDPKHRFAQASGNVYTKHRYVYSVDEPDSGEELGGGEEPDNGEEPGCGDEPESGDEPDRVLRRIFKKNTSLMVHRAHDFPHKGLVIDSVDEFTGMEATVCVVLLSDTDDNRSHTNMQYRMFVASRGIMRTELVFLRPLDRGVTSMMGLENTATAEKYTPPQAAVLWEKDVGDRVSSLTFLLHHGRHVVLYTVYDGPGGKLLAMTTAGDPVTDLPPAFTAVSNPRLVCVSRYQAWAVVSDASGSLTTLVRPGDDWRKHENYSDPSLYTIAAVTITPDGEVGVLSGLGHLYKYDVSGMRQWSVERLGSDPYLTTLGVGPDGALYVPQPDHDTISCYGPDGSQLGSITIKEPRSVCWTDAGLLVGHDRDDRYWVISVVSPDGQRSRRIATVEGWPRAIAAYKHFVAVGTYDRSDNSRLYLFDA